MATKQEYLEQLDKINGHLAEIYVDRKETSYEYRTMKADFEIEEGRTLAMLNSGEIVTANKPTEKDKKHYTIERVEKESDNLWTRLNEAQAKLESLDREYEMLDTRRSIIQTILNKRND